MPSPEHRFRFSSPRESVPSGNNQTSCPPTEKRPLSPLTALPPLDSSQVLSNSPASPSNEASTDYDQKLEKDVALSSGGDPHDSKARAVLNQSLAPQDNAAQAALEGSSKDKKQFIWKEDLSENGQKLYLLLLGDIGFIKYLAELVQMEGIDLDAGLEELRRLDVLDESDAAIIRIRSPYI